MSAPLVWIVFPGVIAAGLYLFRRRRILTLMIGIAAGLGLAGLAWLNPIGEELIFGNARLVISPSLSFLGRQFILNRQDASALILVYLGVAFWFGGAHIARSGRLFVPVGLLIACLVTAALAVEPFLYAAIFIEMAVLVSIPILVPPGTQSGLALLRYLTFQTLGMPFILFTGWLLAGVEASPGDSLVVLHAAVLMALGFAFLLGIFPFHSWMPMLAETSNPYMVAFIFYTLPLSATLLGLGFLDRYAWLRSLPAVPLLLQLTGLLMLSLGGVWSAFESHLGRMFAFGMMVEIGSSLLTLGVRGTQGEVFPLLNVFFASLLPRGLSLGVWGLSLAVLLRASFRDRASVDALTMEGIQGIGRRFPIATSALILALFSIAGFPLSAGFPVRLALWEGLASHSLLLTLISLLGSVGLLVGGMRTVGAFVTGAVETRWQTEETWGERLLLGCGILALLLVGILPQAFLPSMLRMTTMFANLAK